jgi:hypothetical protein
MPLTSDEARAVFPLAWSLPPDRTVEFVREVDAALAGHPAPPMPKRMPDEHANVRLLRRR